MADPYLTPDQVRLREDRVRDTGVYPSDELAELIAEFEDIAERYRGVAYTDREQDCYPGVVYATPPPLVLRLCAEYVRCVAIQRRSQTSRDVIAQTIEGTVTRYSTPNWEQGRPTGWSEIDRGLNSLPDFRVGGIA